MPPLSEFAGALTDDVSDGEPADQLRRQFASPAPVEPGAASRGTRHDEVIEDARADDEPFAGAIAGQVGDAPGPRVRRRADGARLRADTDLPASRPLDARHDFEQSFAARPLEPRDADDLAFAQGKRQGREATIGAVCADMGERQRRSAADLVAVRRVDSSGHVAADHPALNLFTIEFAGLEVADLAAVLENRETVGDRSHFGQMVRDEGDGQALRLQRPHRLQHHIDLSMIEKRGRFVEEDGLRPSGQSAGDLDAFPLAEIERGQRPPHGNIC